MVDLSNDLAYKVLHLHSILNRNNFAFSPTALMCVLVALYEGSAGRSSLEMRNTLLMPNNRDVIRVGYRDIHRRLRTYFFENENPLKGLSLNKENVTITPEYETILNFYGYDLGMDMISSTMQPTTESLNETTTLQTPTTKQEEKMTTTTESPTTTTEQEEVTFPSETTEPPITTTEAFEDDATTPTTEESGETVTLTADLPAEERSNLRRPKTSGKLTSSPPMKYLPVSSKRNRRHLIDPSFYLTLVQSRQQFIQPTPPPAAVGIQHQPQHPLHLISPIDTIAPIDVALPLVPLKSAYHVDVEEGFLPSKPGYNSEVIDHIFYLNDQEIIHTTFKVYNSVLYYRYFEHLKMSVLELELDSTDYNLMIVLPDYDVDILTATSSLRLGPTLRVLRKQLKPRWVQAIIPDFRLHGTMFLTNDLQNMGICDIFEPNRADFRPMTDESGIYVKHIEQQINVNIRTRPINHLKRSYGSQTRPIQVSVNHPFMFFIIDRDLDVATMAGRVLNPLNVRIQ